jgi:hypothetical protein
MTEHRDGHTMERLREHLARADSELETAQHFLDPGSAEGAEIWIWSAPSRRPGKTSGRLCGEALGTVRWRLGEPEG